MHKKKQTKTIRTLTIIVLCLSIFLLSFSVYLKQTGFHNADLGQNINQINLAYGLNLEDTTSQGSVLTGTELYSLGLSQMNVSFVLLGMSVLLIGVCFGRLI